MSACAVEVLKVDCAIVGLLESKNQMGSLGRKNCIKVQRFEGMLCNCSLQCSLSVLLSVPLRFVMVSGDCGDQAVIVLSEYCDIGLSENLK